MPTEKLRYKSLFSESLVTPAQYITELICRNKFKNPPTQFWKLEIYSKEYKSQIPSAYRLLKKFSPEAIIKFLSSKEGLNCYSLRPKWAHEKIQEMEEKIKKEKELAKPIEIFKTNEYRNFQSKKTLWNKL